MVSIPISLEMRDYIEALFYETEARQKLLARALNKDHKDTKSFQDYHDEYMEFNTQYRLALSEIEQIYIAPLYPEHGRFFPDFSKCCVNVWGVDNDKT